MEYQPNTEQQMQNSNDRKQTDPLLWLVGGLVIGAVGAYYFDPARGRSRRALVRDQVYSKCLSAKRSTQRTFKDLSQRVYGMFASARSKMAAETKDETLNQRIRSQIGREVSHVGSIHTFVRDGIVTVSGPILAAEVTSVLSCIKNTPGVKDIINNLDPQTSAKGISALQGAGAEFLR